MPKESKKPYSFRVIIEQEETGGYHGFVPLLSGLHTFGDSLEEIKKNLKEAIICHVRGLVKDKEQIPQEGDALESVQTFSAKELVAQR